MFLLKPWKNQYGEVAEFDEDSSEEDLLFRLKVESQQRERRLRNVTLTILNTTMFLFSFTVLISRISVSEGKNAALKQSSFYSPILNDITIPTFPYTMNGSLFADNNPGLARQDPSPEVDDVWKEFDKTRTLVISREDVVKLGKDPELVAKFEDEYWGFGDDAYMAQMDVFHQIHCLNTLRKIAFEDFYGPVESHWDKWMKMKKPKSVKETPAPKEYYELFGSETGNSHDMLEHDGHH
ncbi:hypothetical protein M7I_4600 [Glarea lozoyensis 74030]|uniref:Uncharacterized protein n=1 Tax=Glarea lozoyensis (strain ATCC 74030 / MF5533) TaxID=1104152 RepID=H0EPL7_GLAL7|nr:hypothetical protein M7I_4600 [Glarea lozoyensis 74030]